jgi:short-subunit dehydrogenase
MLSSIARAELASKNIAVSTVYPFITNSEFIDSIKAGKESAKVLEAGTNMAKHDPGQVAAKILELIKTGAERADTVPLQFGGTYEG